MTIVHVIDDQQSVRTALTEMLSVFGFDARTYESAENFLKNNDAARAGCLVADVRMPGMNGIELVTEMKRRGIPMPVILISGHADVPMAVGGIKAGAIDFIEKPLDDAKLVSAINRGMEAASERENVDRSMLDARTGFERLTPRQIEVFDLVAAGWTSHTIAERLGISQRTVESYRTAVMEKMRADSVAMIVRQAILLKRDLR